MGFSSSWAFGAELGPFTSPPLFLFLLFLLRLTA
jgi:hypothetical protein